MKRLSRQKTKEKAVKTLLLTNYNQYYRLAYSYVHNENDGVRTLTTLSKTPLIKQLKTAAH